MQINVTVSVEIDEESPTLAKRMAEAAVKYALNNSPYLRDVVGDTEITFGDVTAHVVRGK